MGSCVSAGVAWLPGVASLRAGICGARGDSGSASMARVSKLAGSLSGRCGGAARSTSVRSGPVGVGGGVARSGVVCQGLAAVAPAGSLRSGSPPTCTLLTSSVG